MSATTDSAEEKIIKLLIAERRRRICASRAVRIVVQLSNTNVTVEFLRIALNFIEPSHWDDAVDERNATGLCGYVLCSNKCLMTQGKRQRYRICSRTQRVYDMEEYNRFCSPWCLEASNHIRGQISEADISTRENARPLDLDIIQREDKSKSPEAKTPESRLATKVTAEGETSAPPCGQLDDDAKTKNICNEGQTISGVEKVSATSDEAAERRERRRSDRLGSKQSHGGQKAAKSTSPAPPKDPKEHPMVKARETVESWITSDTIRWLNGECLKLERKDGEDEKVSPSSRAREKDRTKCQRLSTTKEEADEIKEDDVPVTVPLVDSHSQRAIRRRIVLEKLSICLRQLLPLLNLSFNVMTPVLKSLLNTFFFTAKNIVMRPPQWTVTTLLLLKIMAKREDEVRDAVNCDEGRGVFEKYFDADVDVLVEELVGNEYLNVD